MPRLRIGINALYLIPGGVGGTEIYLRHLLGALSALASGHDFFLYVNQESGVELCPASPRWTARPTGVQASWRPGRILFEQFRLPSLLRRDGIDVLFNPGFTAPALWFGPQVTVFHDLQHKRHPECFRWWDLPFWELFLWAAVQRSRLLVAVSEQTRADLLHFYGLRPERVGTIWSGVDPRFFHLQDSSGQKGNVLLCASTTHPHKNHPRLLRVFARLRDRLPGWRLMLTGVRGFSDAEVQRLLRALDLERHVVVTGWLPREELYQMFRQARAFVYPSRFEGFGLPVLEALAAGLPTACSAIEPLLTLAGRAALYFDPESEQSMEEAIGKLLTDETLRERLRIEGPAQAAAFSWERTAAQTLAALEEAAQRR